MNPNRTRGTAAPLLAAALAALMLTPASAQMPRPDPAALPGSFCFGGQEDLKGMVGDSDLDVELYSAAFDPSAVTGPVAPESEPQACSNPAGPGAPPSVPPDCMLILVSASLGLPWPSQATADLATICEKLDGGELPNPDIPIVPFPQPRDVCSDNQCELPWASTPEGPPGPQCTKVGDDQGLGGTHVTCDYSCPKNAELLIAVVANDADAGTYGSTECGGAQAACNSGGPACTEPSRGLTRFNERAVSCRGHSDEFVDSPVRVFCSAIGADPCLIIEDFCNRSTFSLLELCLVAGDGAERLAGLVSFVAYTFDQAGGIAVRGDAAPDGSFGCTAQAF